MGGGLGSPPPLASPCKAAFRLMWRCFVLRTNICREKKQSFSWGWMCRGRGRRRLPVFTKQITLATVTANVDSPPLPDYLFANFKWKKMFKCWERKWQMIFYMLLFEGQLKYAWARDGLKVPLILEWQRHLRNRNDCDDDFNPGAWWVTMTKVFMMIWVHIGWNRIKLASWSVRHVRD